MGGGGSELEMCELARLPGKSAMHTSDHFLQSVAYELNIAFGYWKIRQSRRLSGCIPHTRVHELYNRISSRPGRFLYEGVLD